MSLCERRGEDRGGREDRFRDRGLSCTFATGWCPSAMVGWCRAFWDSRERWPRRAGGSGSARRRLRRWASSRCQRGWSWKGRWRTWRRWVEGSPCRAFAWAVAGAHQARSAGCQAAGPVPYLMAAHGMAEPWALRQKAFKKRVYTALVEGKNLREAACLHALSRPEVGHLRALAPRTPVCLVPNGVDPRPFDHLPERGELEAEHPELRGKDVALFYGRLHVKKGLDLLAPALGVLAREFPGAAPACSPGVMMGPGGRFGRLVERQGLTGRVTYLGHVSGASARQVWAAADHFVLPSYSEGFSMAVLEAMACRLPVDDHHGCHFPDARDGRARRWWWSRRSKRWSRAGGSCCGFRQ